MLGAGSKLGPYDIKTTIGTGGMGVVYSAGDSRLNREVAIKVLPVSFSRDSDRLRRFLQEARAAAALNHPNIISIYDIGDDQGAPYVVSELLEGETFRDRLRNGPLSCRKAIEYALQMASGLAAAHDKGIVHRDLKPENIFLTNDGRVKILDFGLAKLTRPEDGDTSGNAPTQPVATDAGMVMGTVGYMSPEQVRGKPADPRSDIFAFGAILYEMLSGKRVFDGDSAADIMSAILKDDPPALTETSRDVSPALERLVRHCLEKNPAERFQSVQDVAFNLEALTDVSNSSRSGVRALPEEPGVRRFLLPVLGALLLLTSWAEIYRFAHRGPIASPTFHEVTFRSGTIGAARFAPDGQTIVYGAAWDGQPQQIFSTRFDSTDSRPVGLPTAQILAISSKGEMAIALHPANLTAFVQSGTLARVPLAGGAPREAVDNVSWADWTPDGESLAVIRPRPDGSAHLEFPAGKPIYEPKGWVSYVRFSPRGDWLAIADHVSNGDDGRVVIVDRHGNRKTSSSFYSSVEGLAWTPNGKEVWFSALPAGSGRSIYALDLFGKERVIYRSPGKLTIHDISRAGLVLMTADKARMSLFALPPGQTHERTLSWFDWSLLTDMSADGESIVFSETGEAGGANSSIFLRRTDGSPAIRLGEGNFAALSPDGQWVIDITGNPHNLVLVPTGAGEPRQLIDDRNNVLGGTWLPDGKSIVFSASEPGHAARAYLLDLQAGAPRALSPEGTYGGLVTPDGKYLQTTDSKRQRWLYPIAGGEPQKLNLAISADERIVSFLADGQSLLLRTRSIPVKIIRVELATGRRELWKELLPADPAGVLSIPVIKFSADGKSYAYSALRVLSDLYVVEGLK
jgi:eukaryotic-like serine/threonine-protein kinase